MHTLYEKPALSNFAFLLRRWRLLNNVKQTYAAELLGVSQGTVSRWESGTAQLTDRQERRIEQLIASPISSSACAALVRLVETSSRPVHLIDDFSHTLHAASTTRSKEFRGATKDLIGSSLWPYASKAIVAAEQGLSEVGWFNAHFQETVLTTDGNDSLDVSISPGRVRWTRFMIDAHEALRLVETLD